MGRVFLLPTLFAVSSIGAPAWALPWPSGTKGQGSRTGGGLAGSVKSFKGFDHCLEELANKLPVEVAAMTLGSAQLELVCRSRQAAAEGDVQICQREVKDYNLRKECERFVAVFTGRASDCPKRGYPMYREGLCQALAQRQPSLCLAAPAEQRGVCRGILLGEAHCGALKAEKRAQCRAEVRAWAGTFKGAKPVLPDSFKPSFEVRATGLTSGVNLPAAAGHFRANALDQGLLVADGPDAATPGGDWLVVNRSFAPQESYDWGSQPPVELELMVPLSSGGTGTFTLASGAGSAKASYREPTGYRHRTMESATGSVTVTRFSRQPGGRVTGTFALELTDGVDRLKVEGAFDTFVREALPVATLRTFMQYRTGSTGYLGSGRLSPDDVALWKAQIKQVKEGLTDVDTALRDAMATDTNKVVYSGSVSRRYQSGNVYSGYRLYSVYPNGALFLLGFRDGDVILKVNKQKLDTPEDVYAAFGRFKKASKLVVELERGGKTVTFTYRVKKLPLSKELRKKLQQKAKEGPKPRAAGILGTLRSGGGGLSGGVIGGSPAPPASPAPKP